MTDNNRKVIVINVLDGSYYDDCHIAGSINIPLRDIGRCEKEYEKDAEIIVYCAHELCTASTDALKALKEMGFTNVRAFEEGMAGWYQADLPVQGSCTLEYLAHQQTKEPETGPEIVSAEDLAKLMGFR